MFRSEYLSVSFRDMQLMQLILFTVVLFYKCCAQADLLLTLTRHHPRLPGVGTFSLLFSLHCPPGLQYQRDKGAANAALVGSAHNCKALSVSAFHSHLQHQRTGLQVSSQLQTYACKSRVQFYAQLAVNSYRAWQSHAQVLPYLQLQMMRQSPYIDVQTKS